MFKAIIGPIHGRVIEGIARPEREQLRGRRNREAKDQEDEKMREIGGG